MKGKFLVTGGTGHAGSWFIQECVEKHPDVEIISIERLERVGLDRNSQVQTRMFRKVYHDLRSPLPPSLLSSIGDVDAIIHLAGEVHAIRSIKDPRPFVETNILGAFNMLEAARQICKTGIFLNVSSADVLGPAPLAWGPDVLYGSHDESAALMPSSPYAASKASAELLCRVYWRSFGVNTITARTTNLFGEKQQATKFIPMVTRKLLGIDPSPLVLHVGRNGEHGQRQWLYVKTFVQSLLFLLERGLPGEVYNVAGFNMSNEEILCMLSEMTGRTIPVTYQNPAEDNKAHEMVFRITDDKIRNLGWVQHEHFATSLRTTVNWIKEHKEWI